MFLNCWVRLSEKNWTFTIFIMAATARWNCIILASVRSFFFSTSKIFGKNLHTISSLPLMHYSPNLGRRTYEKYFESYASCASVVWDLWAQGATTDFAASNFTSQKKDTETLRVQVHKHCKNMINSSEWKVSLTCGNTSYFEHLASNAKS